MQLSILESGAAGKPILFFIHGWPDSASLWKKELAHFSDRYHCIAVHLPGFDQPLADKWGYDFPVLMEMIAETVRRYSANSPDGKVILVGHDWGAYLTYMLEQRHPDLVSAMITLDVGGHFKTRSISHTLFIIWYQWSLIAMFLIGQFAPHLGDRLTRFASRLAKAPRKSDVNYGMNYFYLYFWRSILMRNFRHSGLGRYRPAHPILYLYGGKKRFQFHSQFWVQIVSMTAHGKVVNFPNCMHWLHLEEPEKVHQVMDQWLNKLRGF